MSEQSENALYSQWLASGGCDCAPDITTEQHLRFQARIDQETRVRSDSWANTPEADHERILLMAEIELHLKSCRIFLTSREKMHPVGVDIHDELLAKVTAAIEAIGVKAHGNGIAVRALESMMEATKDEATPIIRRLARVQARHALDTLATTPARNTSQIGEG